MKGTCLQASLYLHIYVLGRSRTCAASEWRGAEEQQLSNRCSCLSEHHLRGDEFGQGGYVPSFILQPGLRANRSLPRSG